MGYFLFTGHAMRRPFFQLAPWLRDVQRRLVAHWFIRLPAFPASALAPLLGPAFCASILPVRNFGIGTFFAGTRTLVFWAAICGLLSAGFDFENRGCSLCLRRCAAAVACRAASWYFSASEQSARARRLVARRLAGRCRCRRRFRHGHCRRGVGHGRFLNRGGRLRIEIISRAEASGRREPQAARHPAHSSVPSMRRARRPAPDCPARGRKQGSRKQRRPKSRTTAWKFA